VRIAVISDIHGNLAALEAVLAAVAGRCDQVWCLGDVVGYGARPNECVDVVRDRCRVVLAGNHDLAACGAEDASRFSHDAGRAIRWTREVLRPDCERWLAGLTPALDRQQIGLYHGSPRDPVWEYVLSVRQAADCLQAQRQRVALIGHSHVACYFSRPNGDAAVEETIGEVAAGGTELQISDGRWLINPGSVGQPRDGDPRAAWLMLDTEAWTASFRRVEYPVETAAKAIVEAGLPRQLADRLFSGQ